MARTIMRNRFAVLLAQKAERDGRGKISHEEVAEKTNVGLSTISRYANNRVGQYSDRVVLALCDYLDCEIGDFLVKVEVEDAPTPEIETALLTA